MVAGHHLGIFACEYCAHRREHDLALFARAFHRERVGLAAHVAHLHAFADRGRSCRRVLVGTGWRNARRERRDLRPLWSPLRDRVEGRKARDGLGAIESRHPHSQSRDHLCGAEYLVAGSYRRHALRLRPHVLTLLSAAPRRARRCRCKHRHGLRNRIPSATAPVNAATIDEVFAPGGPIERALPGFEARPGQVAMAQLVERGILEGMHTIVEAGTGVGKSLAYLIPAVRSGKKIVLSTGTIALQEQLVEKDIPLVRSALDVPLRVSLLKGRSHYLCKQKFERARADRLVASSRTMQRLWDWGGGTRTGDRAELPFVPNGDEWEQLDADADDCVGEFCAHFRDCFFFKKRDEAKYADIVVVNHALFFLDLAMGGGLLPPYDVVVLDEAHQCERWATDALTAVLSRATIGRMMRKLRRIYEIPSHFEHELESGLAQLESSLGRIGEDRYPLAANEEAWPALQDLRATLYRLENWLFAEAGSALKRNVADPAEAERRRDLAMRSVVAHESVIDRAESGAPETIA